MPKWALKTFGPVVCRVRGHVQLDVARYQVGRVQTLTGCTRCLRGKVTDRTAPKYPLPRPR